MSLIGNNDASTEQTAIQKTTTTSGIGNNVLMNSASLSDVFGDKNLASTDYTPIAIAVGVIGLGGFIIWRMTK